MPPAPARAAAFDILVRVERDHAFASELLHSAAHRNLSSPDHALATELVMGVLRWRSNLDVEITQASSHPLMKLDQEVLTSLRLALYQFRHLDRIPQRAALNESVELVKRARKHSAAPFVNAVLRKLSRPLGSPSSQVSSEAEAHPKWLLARWTQHYGPEVTPKICHHNQTIPTTTLRLRTPTAENELQSEGISLTPGALLKSARRLHHGDVTHTQAFRKGHAVIQDEASQLVAALLTADPRKPLRILDCCASPGGKTLALADQNPQAAITATDVHPNRARLLQKLLHRSAPERNIAVVLADARHLPFHRLFDRVLTDVPCSGTGTLSRNPEIKWTLTPKDLTDLQSRQQAILSAALAQVAPGGRLIYSTCSLEKEENEDVIDVALRQNPHFDVQDCGAELTRLQAEGELTWPGPKSLTQGPYLRTIPGQHPTDGFFAAILKKQEGK